MYLQITTKCNMACQHCCYSCSSHGRHADWETVQSMIDFAADWGEIVAIGGGEPTLHPRFFTILELCLARLDYVWLATNGSRTRTMFRLANIMMGDDNRIFTRRPDQLSVALSLDKFHDKIDQRVVDLWRRQKFEIRNVENRVIGQGRAKETGVGQLDDCVCNDLFVQPDGSIKLCGCKEAPVIGHVQNGIGRDWLAKMDCDEFVELGCYRALERRD